MKGKIQRFLIDEQTARMHEAVSDSVYVVGAKAAERAVGEIAVGERPSGTLTDMVNNITKARKISILHLSDNHGWLGGLKKMAALLAEGNDAFGINTGDITNYSAINGYAAVLKVMSDWNAQCNGRPILLLKGNHDTWDTNIGNNEKQCTHTLLKPVDAGFVKWGEATGGEWNDNIVGGYWHKDVVENGVKLRVIALDEYQHSVGDPRRDSLYYYTKVYSQAQVDWLVNLLKSTPSDAYIVMCHHQPLYTTHPSTVMNDFVHHGIVGAQMDSNTSHVFSYKMYTYKPENVDMAARIVDAYLHKKHLVLTSYPSGVDGVTLNIDADFRGIKPAKFACHLCGHVHGDYCEHHPDFHEQICLTVGTDSPSISSWYEDLVRSQTTGNVASYVINRVTIDADRDVVRVDRIGAHELNVDKKYNGVTLINNDGSSRDWIEFAIPNGLSNEPTIPDTAQMATKSELASYNPIIEDTRSSAAAAITGVAPFSVLVDGQRIVLHSKFYYTGAAAFTLNLTLSDGSTTGAKNIKYITTTNSWNNCANTGISGKIQNGVYYQLYFDIAKDAWLMEQDSIQNLTTMTQAEINAGNSTQPRTISPKMLRDNFYLKSEIETKIGNIETLLASI